MRITTFALTLLTIFSFAHAQDLRVLNDYGLIEPEEMMSRYLRTKAHQAIESRNSRVAALTTPAELTAYQEEIRTLFIERLGGFPERTPLNPVVVSTKDYDTFRVERIIYESQPKFYVTAALYLPIGEGPFPAVLVPCGHSEDGKAAETYQRVCMLLAQNGIAALCYDPIGQGERYQILDKDGGPRFSSTLEHTMVGVGNILLGINTATYRIWDGIRGIDYLVSRDDIDANSLGCTGNSGGGTLTSYIMALDPRVKAAAPSCYITSFDRLIDTIGPQDAEQNIFGQIAFGMDHAEYLTMRAPRPTLICAATKDFFDIEGTRSTFQEAREFYAKLGHQDRLQLVEANEEHGFSQPLRVAAVQWMRRWLLDDDTPIVESDTPLIPASELQCTPNGQVLLIDDAHTIFEMNMQFEMKLGQRRHFTWKDRPKHEFFDEVRKVANVTPLDAGHIYAHQRVGKIQKTGYRIEKYSLSPEPGIQLPALLYIPENPSGEAHMIVHEYGKEALRDQQALLAEKGHAVLSVDLRGLGETSNPEEKKTGFGPYFGGDWNEILLAYLLGESYVGMRTNDIFASLQFLGNHLPADMRKRLHFYAQGETTVPALHVAALEPQIFSTIRLDGCTPSWIPIISAEETRNQLVNTVHGALATYDLTDLITSIPPSKLRIRAVKPNFLPLKPEMKSTPTS